MIDLEIGNWGSDLPVEHPGVHWIWPRNGNGLQFEHAFFRHLFTLPCPDTLCVSSAFIDVTVDNEYIIYVNGVELGSDGDCSEPYEGDIWQTAETYDIELPLLNPWPEVNVLAIHGYNNYLIAGARYRLVVSSGSPVETDSWSLLKAEYR
jgi:hypothetical protein